MSTDIVPFQLHSSTLLADKLVESPPEEFVEKERSNKMFDSSGRIKSKVMKHDQVLEQFRGNATSKPPKVTEWLEMRDSESKKVYYHNKVTGKSVWNKPEGFDEATALDTKNEGGKGTFWIEVQDSKGRTYYYDLLSKETRWDRPKDFEADHDEETKNVVLQAY